MLLDLGEVVLIAFEHSGKDTAGKILGGHKIQGPRPTFWEEAAAKGVTGAYPALAASLPRCVVLRDGRVERDSIRVAS